MVRFAPEHVVLFLRLCDLGRKERHKATTRNGVPQGKKTPTAATVGVCCLYVELYKTQSFIGRLRRILRRMVMGLRICWYQGQMGWLVRIRLLRFVGHCLHRLRLQRLLLVRFHRREL